MSLTKEFIYDYFLGMTLIRKFPDDYLLGMSFLSKDFLITTFIGNFPMTNINSVQEIKHFILQQKVNKPIVLSNKQFLCMYLCFKKVITKVFKCL